ncbi:hypothetical protein RJ639_029004 [Escallonia herrerae]|uniref:N-acetyltransferase domain-containing protein n=1 Tax=Escallonia herrerae TaxID=1293975 RepID=A0AA89BGW5_9ASTE|nr:hypothetical protein RJ639_029004 [Escallonia herrerae]
MDDEYLDISLRLLDPSDVDDFMVWATDDKVSKFCSWDTYTSKQDAMSFIVNVVVPHRWFRAICLKGRPVGAIAVTPNEGHESCRAELGYVLASEYWGKGIGTRAVKLVASSIFFEWPHLERLEALVDVENSGSQRVLDKVGFKREGVLRTYILLKGRPRDMVMFSLLRTELHCLFEEFHESVTVIDKVSESLNGL